MTTLLNDPSPDEIAAARHRLRQLYPGRTSKTYLFKYPFMIGLFAIWAVAIALLAGVAGYLVLALFDLEDSFAMTAWRALVFLTIPFIETGRLVATSWDADGTDTKEDY